MEDEVESEESEESEPEPEELPLVEDDELPELEVVAVIEELAESDESSWLTVRLPH